jgi:hypothetical protein
MTNTSRIIAKEHRFSDVLFQCSIQTGYPIVSGLGQVSSTQPLYDYHRLCQVFSGK